MSDTPTARMADDLVSSSVAPQTQEIIHINDLSLYYGAARALVDISLKIRENVVTAFIGPSGCGKSTLLRCLNRMNDLIDNVRIDGSCEIGGHNIYGSEVDVIELRKRVGMVFQKSNPFPKSIYENIAFALRLHGMTKKSDLDATVERSLRQAALWEEVKDRLHSSGLGLSGGQQQRLCIARAVAIQPEILLMDEPASALDPLATAKIEELVLDLKKDYTIVIVTHNMQQAARVSDYTAFFYQELSLLKQKLLTLASHAEEAVSNSLKSLLERSDLQARTVIETDSLLDGMEVELDEMCISMLALHSPIASDLRLITTAMKITHDLERVGDEATTIARRVIELNTEPQLKPYIDISRMGLLALAMLKDALDAFVHGDSVKARAIVPRDKQVDQLHKQLHKELVNSMIENSASITRGLNIMVISKSLERVADHAANIAEEVVYLYESLDIRHSHDNDISAPAFEPL